MITSQHLREKQKDDGDFQKYDGVFPKNLPRFSDFVGDNRRNKGKEKTKTKRKKEYTQRNPRQKQKQIHSKNKKEEEIYTKESTAKTKRIPHKIGRKEGQFVHKSKDLRSKILMQT